MNRGDVQRAPTRLDTLRLRLEAPQLRHAAAFVDSLNASLANLEFIDWTHEPVDLAWGERFVTRGEHHVGEGDCLIYYAFEVAPDGAYVGRLDLHSFDFDAPRGEIGYVGDVRNAGRGLMREAALAVVELGFSLGLARVQAMSDARNTRALRFAQSLGFVREGVLRNYERAPDGQLCEQVMFAAYDPRAA